MESQQSNSSYCCQVGRSAVPCDGLGMRLYPVAAFDDASIAVVLLVCYDCFLCAGMKWVCREAHDEEESVKVRSMRAESLVQTQPA